LTLSAGNRGPEARTAEVLLIIDMAAKRRKKHKNKILSLVISMCYNEQK